MQGKILRLRYSIVKKLGSGGFGDTYLARDLDLPGKPLCVVKHLQQKDPKVFTIAKNLFEREAEILSKLGEHPQIPTLKAYFQEDSEFYLVQEFIHGYDLTREILRGKPLTKEHTLKLLKEILSVLSFVHEAKIIHRDLKPANVMRRQSDGKIFLIDFGAVKEISTLVFNSATNQTSVTVAIGSPGYMPNEQANGKPKFASDVYALGMIALEALTGLHPSQIPQDEETDEFLWRPHTSGVSDEVAKIIDKMIAGYAPHRYKNATVALNALSQLQNENEAVKTKINKAVNSFKPILEEREKQKIIEEKKPRLIEDLGNGVILELVEIPAGRFLMGGKEITLENFLMGKYPVTQAQWFAVMGNNPSHFKGDRRPVEGVDWYKANGFCNKLSALTARKYQLPSESQWEYACRAGKPIFGDQELDKYAWYSINSNKQTHPVGEKLPNPWGLYDILGNVWEWCRDDWQESYGHIPVNGTAYINNNSTKKSLRGGAWLDSEDLCSSDFRDRIDASSRYNFIGLRVVMLPGVL